ncbi:hypothetical protein GEMRC1_002862 [Eukaryota sp. GEM-RC1]
MKLVLSTSASVLGAFIWIYNYRRSRHRLLRKQSLHNALATFNQDPLFPPFSDQHVICQPITVSSITPSKLHSLHSSLLNFSSLNFFNLATNKSVLSTCASTITKYGVGSCGPRGFYGTMDCHLDLETDIAALYNTSDAVVYPLSHATTSSVLPCFASRGDLIVLDQYSNEGLRTGSILSRADMIYFNHNDVIDLEKVFKEQEQLVDNESSKRRRKSCSIEGNGLLWNLCTRQLVIF